MENKSKNIENKKSYKIPNKKKKISYLKIFLLLLLLLFIV